MSCEHEHYHGHSHSHSHSHDGGDDHVPPIPTNQAQSLREFVDFSKLTALNVEQKNDELYKVFKSYEERFMLTDFIQSDADAQFILNIPFTGNVKLYSIILRSHGDSNHCPKTIKLFKNRSDLDFDNINEVTPTFKFDQPQLGPLIDDDNDNATIDNDSSTFVEHHLPRTLFQSTTQLTLFIQDNWEDDEDELTKVYYIELRGIFTSPLSKDPIITLYESAANPADHKNLLSQEIGNQSNV